MCLGSEVKAVTPVGGRAGKGDVLGGGSGGGGRGDGSSGWALEWLSPTGDTLSQTYDHVRPVPEDQLNQLDQLDQLGSRQGL